MKKLFAILLTLCLSLQMTGALAQDQSYTIGIEQFAEHSSLDNCREGFLKGLAQEGFVEGENLTVLYQNAQADMGNATQIAQSFVSRGVDLICGIATPSAQAVYNAVFSARVNIPAIYTAVSAPVEAGLAMEDGTPVGEVTGTSDLLPVHQQLQMIRELMPEATTIGLLSTASEANSEVQVRMYQDYAPEYGFEIVSVVITAGNEVAQGIEALLPQVDCVSMITDNTVVSYLPTVLAAAQNAGKPVFGSEIEQVALGCLAAEGLDYVELGVRTGVMAARVLKGEKASDIPFEVVVESALYYNSEVAADLNIVLSDAILERGTDMAE